jgi:hypothetical protein
MAVTGLAWAEQCKGRIDAGMVEYSPKPEDASVGTVYMAAYLDWLRRNGYTMGNLRVQ